MLVWSWCKFGATLYQTILTIFTISNGIAKTQRDNFDLWSKLAKNALLMQGIFCYLVENNELSLRAWIGISHELHRWCMNCLRHLKRRGNSILGIEDFKSWSQRLQFMTALRQFIFKEYKSQFLWESITICFNQKRAVQLICWAVLFTFLLFCGMTQR